MENNLNEVKETNKNWWKELHNQHLFHRLHRVAKYPVPAILEDTKEMGERNIQWLVIKQMKK